MRITIKILSYKNAKFNFEHPLHFDKSNKSILASGNFQRNLSVGGNLILGTETIYANNNVNGKYQIRFKFLVKS